MAALLGAEWLLIFKMWVAPGPLTLLIFMGVFRLALYVLFPNFMGVSVVFFFAGVALIWHLKDTLSGRVILNRDTFNTPATGVPRLIILARNIKFAHGLECAIIAACLLLYIDETPLYFPDPPPGTKEWFLKNQRLVAFAFAALPFIGVMLWNLPTGKRQAKKEAQYKKVSQQSHSVSQLPSVKDLIEEYEVDKGTF